jgi:hypothetical protein
VVEDGLHAIPQSLRTTAHTHAELTKAQRDKKNQNETPVDLMHVISFLERAILHLDHTKIGTDIMELLAVLSRDGSSAADLSPWRK